MRRADRLFQIIQILRGARKPITARKLAEFLEQAFPTRVATLRAAWWKQEQAKGRDRSSSG